MWERDKNKGGVVINKTTDVATVEQMFRIIQSIPSPKAEVAELSKQKNPQGFRQSARVAQQGGSVAKATRQQLESQLGRSVISPINAKATLSAKKDTLIEVEK